MEKADKTLSQEINKRKSKSEEPFTSQELFEFFKTLISVFAFCAKCKITHNDIKPSNILLTKRKESKDNNFRKINKHDFN